MYYHFKLNTKTSKTLKANLMGILTFKQYFFSPFRRCLIHLCGRVRWLDLSQLASERINAASVACQLREWHLLWHRVVKHEITLKWLKNMYFYIRTIVSSDVIYRCPHLSVNRRIINAFGGLLKSTMSHS